MGKRTNTQVSAKATAKKAKCDPVFTSITEVIMEAEDLPARCRTMLVESLPFSLGTPSEERHEIQTAVRDMVEQTLNAKKVVMEAAVVAEETKLATLNISRVDVESAVGTAEAALVAQKEVVQSAKLALAEASTVANASRKTLTDLSEEQKTADAKLAVARDEKTALESAFENHFKPMKADAAGPHFKELEPFLQKIEIEASLLIALPSTCAKATSDRGTFDNVVLEELEKSICAKVASLGETVAAETPASLERDSAVQAAQTDFDAKKESQMKAVAEFEAAQKEQNGHEAALSQATQARDESQPQIDLVTGFLEKAKVALEAFQAGPLAGFKNYGIVEAVVAEAAPLGA